MRSRAPARRPSVARSAMSLRYCITWRGRLKPSAPTMRPPRPNSDDELPLRVRAVRDVHVGVGRHDADGLDLAVVLVGPHERHRRERRRVVVAREQPARRVHTLLGRVGPVLEPHQLRRRTAGWASARRRRPRRCPARPRHVSSHTTPLSSVSPDPSSQRGLGHDADADHHDVGVDRRSRRRAARARRARRLRSRRPARRCAGRRRDRGACRRSPRPAPGRARAPSAAAAPRAP